LSSSEQWRWTDGEGVQRLLRGDELRTALADGRLKPDTLVWRRGMKNWRAAKEVPELVAIQLEDEEDEGATITQERPKTLGQKSPPTPSIPPTPGNMVDISSLRFQQGGRHSHEGGLARPVVPTLMGVGSSKGERHEVRIPVAPKMPRIDGGWRDGAARRDDDEQTVTRVRPEDDEESTLSSRSKLQQKQRTKNYGSKSVAPPRKRGRQTQPTGSLPDLDEVKRAGENRGLRPNPRANLPGSAGNRIGGRRNKAAKSIPPPVKSNEVLSEAFSSATKTQQPASPSTLVSADARQQALIASAKRVRGAKSVPPPKRSVPPPPKRSAHPPARAQPQAPVRSKLPATPASKALPLANRRPDTKTQLDPDASVETSAPPLANPPPKANTANTSVLPDAATSQPPKNAKRRSVERIPTGPLPAVRPEGAGDGPQPAFANEPWAKKAAAASRAAALKSRARAEEPAPLLSVAQQPHASLTGSVVGAPVVEPPGRAKSRVADHFTRNTALAAAGIAVALVGASFLLGRLSAPAEAGMASAVARRGMLTVPLFARARASTAPPRPCLMKRAPGRFAPEASKSIPIELAPAGDKLAVGFAASMKVPRGILIDLDEGVAEEVHAPEAAEASDVSRVVPVVQGGEVIFATTLAREQDVRAGVYVAAQAPFVVGFTDDNLVRQPKRNAEPAPLWPLDPPGKRADALQARASSTSGTAVAYRYDGQIFYGALNVEGAVTLSAQAVEGSGGKVGKPSVATDGREVSVVFADKPPVDDARIELRWARGPLGKPLTTAAVVELPPGGPGGDAIAPAIAALPGRRWLLMWTEGKRPGPYTLRAQTYDAKYRPVGEALRVSPGTGSFGQGTVGVVGEDAAVLFLLATQQGYEIWGTVLQCR
jgi:GYF domain 2